MGKIFGWKGKILKIDLTCKKTEILEPETEVYHKFIGGRGLAGFFFRKYMKSGDAPLIFMTGPLTGTAAPSSSFFNVMSKSPLSGTVSDFSHGGEFGTEIKKSGFDGIIITGTSEETCGITLSGGGTLINNAQNLLGLNYHDLKERIGISNSMAMTGIAADSGVHFANIVFDGKGLSGRSGLGLIMARKGIKYISITGDEKIKCFDKDRIEKSSGDIYRLISASPILKGELGFANFGTATLFDLMESRRMMPVHNFRETYFEGGEKLNASSIKKKYNFNGGGCEPCEVKCIQSTPENHNIPGYEELVSFTSMIGNRDMDRLMACLKICNDAGMDPVSAASSIACHMEINGLSIDDVNIESLLLEISGNRLTGAELAKGSLSYAESRGQKEKSMSIKGLDIPPFDPRGAYGLALSMATSNRGACHFSAYPISYEILRKPVALDRFSFSGKARIIKVSEDLNAAADSLGICKYIFLAASLEEYAPVFNAATGLDFTAGDIQIAGERAFCNERIINSDSGFTIDEDTLPERFFTEEGSSGEGIEIPPIDKDEFNKTIQKYYRIRGLSEKGMPLKEKIEELGI